MGREAGAWGFLGQEPRPWWGLRTCGRLALAHHGPQALWPMTQAISSTKCRCNLQGCLGTFLVTSKNWSPGPAQLIQEVHSPTAEGNTATAKEGSMSC